jgi:hypothetical protein
MTKRFMRVRVNRRDRQREKREITEKICFAFLGENAMFLASEILHSELNRNRKQNETIDTRVRARGALIKIDENEQT